MASAVVCVLLAFCLSGELIAAKKLIVVLVDGVRWDYIKDPELKGIHRIIENGVKAKYVVPIFPTLSYPNWYTLVTGLYAENHGFVANHMYDNETNTFFNMIPSQGATDPHWWNEAEPLWVTAEKNNKRSALYWWGGCEVEIRNTHPAICERQLYDGPPTPEGKVDFLERIDDMLEMFKPSKRFPVDRLSLALLYYVSVDYEGHHQGPNSKDTKAAMRDIDEMLEKMQSKIQKAGLKDEVNIMVVSDHGMTDVRNTTAKYIALEKYASKIKYQMEYGGISMIVPQPGMLDKVSLQPFSNIDTRGVLAIGGAVAKVALFHCYSGPAHSFYDVTQSTRRTFLLSYSADLDASFLLYILVRGNMCDSIYIHTK